MKFTDCINNVSTLIDLKRLANKYVFDYRRLPFDDLKQAMITTAPQYYNKDNVNAVIDTDLRLNPNPDIRTLYRVILKQVLLNKDGFSAPQKDLEDEVISYEQSVLDKENEDETFFSREDISLLSFVVNAAWENNSQISIDEENLILKIKEKLAITDEDYELVLAHNSLFPKHNNILHSRTEISDARKVLQQLGVLFVVRDSNGVDYDIVPEEIALLLREYFKIDIKQFSYSKLLESKYVKKKPYLIDILQKAGIALDKSETLDSLSYKMKRYVTAHQLIGGFSARDGLNASDLIVWCSDLGLPTSGTKNELIDRIIGYYDSIQKISVKEEDERALYFEYFEDLACRNLDKLRKQGVIEKDLDCERKFEQATNYLFEKILRTKPLMLKGTEHPDGMLSFGNKLILWDNKSKETPVSLNDHIKQFDRYIKEEEKTTAVFMVIGPSFTEDSPKECMKYSMTNDTNILLITASELKNVAEIWMEKHANDEETFPLGFFKQCGRFDISLVSFN
ncbi:MAG: hypothetical protein IKW76_05115 [Clostridia bacterium]|nr:hypothetical protein [Clostridia bacterium]